MLGVEGIKKNGEGGKALILAVKMEGKSEGAYRTERRKNTKQQLNLLGKFYCNLN